MAECLLFAYGLLQPQYRAPASLGKYWPDELQGELYDLGPYPGAIRIGAGEDYFHGCVLTLDDSEFPELDAFEQVDEGQYIRRRVQTRGGSIVWVYEYSRALPAGAKRISRWVGK
jgi:gamma-glutamylcyclotransferase (GGCT)/AIG2-like uncharacterized protein YtfP